MSATSIYVYLDRNEFVLEAYLPQLGYDGHFGGRGQSLAEALDIAAQLADRTAADVDVIVV